MPPLRARCALPALSAAAVLALTTGCGSDDPPTAASASSPAGSAASSPAGSAASSSASASAASSSGPSEAQLTTEFCAKAPALLQDITTDLNSVQSAPTEAPQKLSAAVDELNTLQPPASVTPQWQRFVGAVTGLRDLIAKVDLTNPQANTQYAPQLQALQPDLVDGGSAIDDWGKAHC